LSAAGVSFEVQPADIPEELRPGEAADAFAIRLAREKALAVARKLGSEPPQLVLGADTVVVVDGRALGKPRDADHAIELLRVLSGRRHVVVTAIAVTDSSRFEVRSRAVETAVHMRAISDDEIRAYVASGEPLDKAGAYAIQGGARRFVSRIEGSESNVIGLPVEETLALLEQALSDWAVA